MHPMKLNLLNRDEMSDHFSKVKAYVEFHSCPLCRGKYDGSYGQIKCHNCKLNYHVDTDSYRFAGRTIENLEELFRIYDMKAFL
jgi:hypothetical protein